MHQYIPKEFYQLQEYKEYMKKLQRMQQKNKQIHKQQLEDNQPDRNLEQYKRKVDKEEFFKELNDISQLSQKSLNFFKIERQQFHKYQFDIRVQMTNHYKSEKKRENARLKFEEQEKEKLRLEQAKKKQRLQKIEYQQSCLICRRQYTLQNFPLSLGCPHFYCPLCIYSMAQSNIDYQNQQYIIQCPQRDATKIILVTQNMSEDIQKNLIIPDKDKFTSERMRVLINNVQKKKAKLPTKKASGIFLNYRCKCKFEKTAFLGIKEVDIVEMEQEMCLKCRRPIPIKKIIFQDCKYQINGQGDTQQFDHEDGNATGKTKEIKIECESWQYLEFSATKPNVD